MKRILLRKRRPPVPVVQAGVESTTLSQDVQAQVASSTTQAPLTRVDIEKLLQEAGYTHPLKLAGANLRGIDLTSFNLAGADLSHANLMMAKLSEVNLSGATLVDANLCGANLIAANLSDADLSHADLIGANLSVANLRGANLTDANLSRAIVILTRLKEAILQGTNFSGVNLSGTNLSGITLDATALSGTILNETRLYEAEKERLRKSGAIDLEKAIVLSLDSTRGAESVESAVEATNQHTSAPLPQTFLDGLVAELDNETIQAIALTGSYARGETHAYSDVDLLRFVSTLPEHKAERHTLAFRDGHLVSISTTTIPAKRADLSKPEEAIFAVSGLRQARILLDKDGSLTMLLQEAHTFTWEPLQASANAYASDMLMGVAEEIHKLLGMLMKHNESAILNATVGLLLGLTRAVATQRGLFIESENSYFQQVQEAVGRTCAWTCYHRLTAGFDTPDSSESGSTTLTPIEVRGIAGLHLYQETASLLRPILEAKHLDVIGRTLAAILQSGLALPL